LLGDAVPDWTKFPTWNLVLPPNRPPQWYVTLAESVLLRSRSEEHRTLVLGSTPELLDLTARLRIATVVVEKSPEFYKQVLPLRAFPAAEELITGDWIDVLSETREQYSVVLSDLTWGNVPYQYQQAFSSAVSDRLAPNGVLLDRVLINEIGMKPISELIQKFEHRVINLQTLNDFNAEFLFTSELVEENGLVDSSRILAQLEVLLEGHPNCLKLLSEVQSITPQGHTWYYGKKWLEVREAYFPDLKRRFRHESPPDDAYHRFVVAFEMCR